MQTLHIYTRVSTTNQEDEGTSLETQKELGIKKSLELGMDYQIWDEGGQSSSKDDLSNRPVLSDLLIKIDKGVVKHLYVWNVDRLSRNQVTWGMIRIKLIQNNVVVHTPTGKQILSDPATNLMLGILSEIAYYDNQIRTLRFRLGRKYRVREGNWLGGPPPYGYRIENKKLVIDKDEGKTVKYIFESYRSGLTLRQIRNDLFFKNKRPRRGGLTFTIGSLEKILRNTHYQGYFMVNFEGDDEPTKGTCPRLLDDELIESVKILLQERSYSNRQKNPNEKHFYLLKGLLFDRNGKPLTGYKQTNGRPKYKFYVPNRNTIGQTKTKRRTNRNITTQILDDLVWGKTLDVVANSTYWKEIFKRDKLDGVMEIREEKKKLERKLRTLQTNYRDLEDRKTRLENKHDKLIKMIPEDEKDRMRQEIDLEISECQETIKETHNSLAEISLRVGWVDWTKGFEDWIQEQRDITDPHIKRDFLEKFISRIEISDSKDCSHHVTIRYNFPIVGGKLVWKYENGKKKGYDLKTGSHTLEVVKNINNIKKKLTISP